MRHGLVAGLLFYIFIKLSQALTKNEFIYFDQRVSQYIFDLYSPYITVLMKGFTDLGSTQAITTFTLVAQYYLLRKLEDYWKSFFSLMAVIGSWGLNEVLKEYFQRLRPEAHRLIEINGYSFPSGHAMVSTAFYGIIAYLFYVNSKTFLYNKVFPAVLLLLAILIGISRVYLGVHYPSDVIAGFVAGAAWLFVCIFVSNIVIKINKKNPS